METGAILEQKVIIFDGVCNLCSRSVQFIIKRDKRSVFKFSPLQSKFGREKLVEHGLNPDDAESFLLIKDGHAYTKSDAAIEIAREFRGSWKLIVGVALIPRPVRDKVYSLVVKNRYRLFGKRESCLVPTEAIKSRFIE